MSLVGPQATKRSEVELRPGQLKNTSPRTLARLSLLLFVSRHPSPPRLLHLKRSATHSVSRSGRGARSRLYGRRSMACRICRSKRNTASLRTGDLHRLNRRRRQFSRCSHRLHLDDSPPRNPLPRALGRQLLSESRYPSLRLLLRNPTPRRRRCIQTTTRGNRSLRNRHLARHHHLSDRHQSRPNLHHVHCPSTSHNIPLSLHALNVHLSPRANRLDSRMIQAPVRARSSNGRSVQDHDLVSPIRHRHTVLNRGRSLSIPNTRTTDPTRRHSKVVRHRSKKCVYRPAPRRHDTLLLPPAHPVGFRLRHRISISSSSSNSNCTVVRRSTKDEEPRLGLLQSTRTHPMSTRRNTTAIVRFRRVLRPTAHIILTCDSNLRRMEIGVTRTRTTDSSRQLSSHTPCPTVNTMVIDDENLPHARFDSTATATNTIL